MQETWVWSLAWEDPLEKGKAPHSSILAWRIPWTPWGLKESDRLKDTRDGASEPHTALDLILAWRENSPKWHCADDWQSVHVSHKWNRRAALMLHWRFWKLYCGYIKESLFLGNTSRYSGSKRHGICNLISSSYKKKSLSFYSSKPHLFVSVCYLEREAKHAKCYWSQNLSYGDMRIFGGPVLATSLQENMRSYQKEKDRRQLSLSGLAQRTWDGEGASIFSCKWWVLFSISVWIGVLDSPEITGSLRGEWCLFQRFCRELVAEAVNVPSRRPKEEIRKPSQWLPNWARRKR